MTLMSNGFKFQFLLALTLEVILMICPNKTEDLNQSVFNIITGINKSKILIKHICIMQV